MDYILAIDAGSSAVKFYVVPLGQGEPRMVAYPNKKSPPPLEEFLGDYLSNRPGDKDEIQLLALTGVGASFHQGQLGGIPTCQVSELEAIGRGGLALSGKEDALVVNLGTGTTLLDASLQRVIHIGGTGVGAGTLQGLGSKLVGTSDVTQLGKLALPGRLGMVDTTISDISQEVSPTLPPDLTAANFGKMSPQATDADIAKALINMVFETVGMLCFFAGKTVAAQEVVLTGGLSALPQAREIFDKFTLIYGLRFQIPPHSPFATAAGAALLAAEQIIEKKN